MAAGTSNAAPVAENVTNNEGMIACIFELRKWYNFFVHLGIWSLFIVMEFFHKKETFEFISWKIMVFFP